MTTTHTTMNDLNTIKQGDILYSRWGYGQINVNFYIVTKRTAHFVEILGVRAVRKYDNRHVFMLTYTATPEPVTLADTEGITGTRRRIKMHKDIKKEYVNVCDFERAYKWNGEPVQGDEAP